MNDRRQPSVFVPHGAGPSFFMNFGPLTPAMWTKTCAHLSSIAASLPERPRAILIVSGHWETPVPTINVAAKHSLYFDYYNGSAEAYRLEYPAKGEPEVALQVADLLAQSGIASLTETDRGLDHGVFLPLMLMFPEADIPVIQLSLDAGADPAKHIAIGRAIEPLRDQGVLIVGSGMTFHNHGLLGPGLKGIINTDSHHFDAWLFDAVTAADPADRTAALIDWESAPAARHAHPTAEHLLPLHIVAGAAGIDIGRHVFRDTFLGATFSAYHFG